MIDWKKKLSSRKFWLAVVGLISGILTLFKMPESDVAQIGGVIMAVGSVVSYILAEGFIDAANAGYVYEDDPDDGD